MKSSKNNYIGGIPSEHTKAVKPVVEIHPHKSRPTLPKNTRTKSQSNAVSRIKGALYESSSMNNC